MKITPVAVWTRDSSGACSRETRQEAITTTPGRGNGGRVRVAVEGMTRAWTLSSEAGAAGSAGDLDLGEERMATASGGEQLEGSNYFRRWGKFVAATGGETMGEIRS